MRKDEGIPGGGFVKPDDAYQPERDFYTEHYAMPCGVDELQSTPEQFIFQEFESLGWKSDRNRFAFGLVDRSQLTETIVLDYACGSGRWGVFFAQLGAQAVYGFDLSETGIQTARLRALVNGVANSTHFVVMSATDLGFASDTFDLTWGHAALHHVLKYPGIGPELHRVLKPGGQGIFCENYGHFLPTEVARWVIRKRLDAERFEMVLRREQILEFGSSFEQVDIFEMSFLHMIKRLWYGEYHRPSVQRFLGFVKQMDDALLSAVPKLRRYCGESVIRVIK
jgi:ubiquinone/menaquinone biosynthesis C-methylase UbiE